jgi:hypothetical protein
MTMYKWYCSNDTCESKNDCNRNVMHHTSMTVIASGEFVRVQLDGNNKCSDYEKRTD